MFLKRPTAVFLFREVITSTPSRLKLVSSLSSKLANSLRKLVHVIKLIASKVTQGQNFWIFMVWIIFHFLPNGNCSLHFSCTFTSTTLKTSRKCWSAAEDTERWVFPTARNWKQNFCKVLEKNSKFLPSNFEKMLFVLLILFYFIFFFKRIILLAFLPRAALLDMFDKMFFYLCGILFTFSKKECDISIGMLPVGCHYKATIN